MTEAAVLYRILYPDPAVRREVASEFFARAEAPLKLKLLIEFSTELTRSRSAQQRVELHSMGENSPSQCRYRLRLAPDWRRVRRNRVVPGALGAYSSGSHLIGIRFCCFPTSNCYRRAGRLEEAATHLRLALSQPPRYAYFPKVDKLVADLAAGTETHLRQCRIAILGASATALLVPVLKSLCFRDGSARSFTRDYTAPWTRKFSIRRAVWRLSSRTW